VSSTFESSAGRDDRIDLEHRCFREGFARPAIEQGREAPIIERERDLDTDAVPIDRAVSWETRTMVGRSVGASVAGTDSFPWMSTADSL